MSAIFLFALSGRGRVVHVARFHQRITMALENLGWQYLSEDICPVQVSVDVHWFDDVLAYQATLGACHGLFNGLLAFSPRQ